MQKLQRHAPPELGVLRFIHQSHAPATQLAEDFVMSHCFVVHKRAAPRLGARLAILAKPHPSVNPPSCLFLFRVAPASCRLLGLLLGSLRCGTPSARPPKEGGGPHFALALFFLTPRRPLRVISLPSQNLVILIVQ